MGSHPTILAEYFDVLEGRLADHDKLSLYILTKLECSWTLGQHQVSDHGSKHASARDKSYITILAFCRAASHGWTFITLLEIRTCIRSESLVQRNSTDIKASVALCVSADIEPEATEYYEMHCVCRLLDGGNMIDYSVMPVINGLMMCVLKQIHVYRKI